MDSTKTGDNAGLSRYEINRIISLQSNGTWFVSSHCVDMSFCFRSVPTFIAVTSFSVFSVLWLLLSVLVKSIVNFAFVLHKVVTEALPSLPCAWSSPEGCGSFV